MTKKQTPGIFTFLFFFFFFFLVGVGGIAGQGLVLTREWEKLFLCDTT